MKSATFGLSHIAFFGNKSIPGSCKMARCQGTGWTAQVGDSSGDTKRMPPAAVAFTSGYLSESSPVTGIGISQRFILAGWWFGTWLLFFQILGSSSSQLTNSYFSDGSTTKQIGMWVFVTSSGEWLEVAFGPSQDPSGPTRVFLTSRHAMTMGMNCGQIDGNCLNKVKYPHLWDVWCLNFYI